MIQIPRTGINWPHQSQQDGKHHVKCKQKKLMAFQMENKRPKGQKHSKFIYHGFCGVEGKPSEVKSHLRPEVDRCGEGDWGKK